MWQVVTDISISQEQLRVASGGVTVATQTDLIERISQSQVPAPRQPQRTKPTAASDASWQRRLELAHARITELTELTAEKK